MKTSTSRTARFSKAALVASLLALTSATSEASSDVRSTLKSGRTAVQPKDPAEHAGGYANATDNSGFRSAVAPVYLQMLKAISDHETASSAQRDRKHLPERMMYNLYEEMKERFWLLNEQAVIEQLISQGLLDPSFGYQFAFNYVPTYQDDIFAHVFSDDGAMDTYADAGVYAGTSAPLGSTESSEETTSEADLGPDCDAASSAKGAPCKKSSPADAAEDNGNAEGPSQLSSTSTEAPKQTDKAPKVGDELGISTKSDEQEPPAEKPAVAPAPPAAAVGQEPTHPSGNHPNSGEILAGIPEEKRKKMLANQAPLPQTVVAQVALTGDKVVKNGDAPGVQEAPADTTTTTSPRPLSSASAAGTAVLSETENKTEQKDGAPLSHGEEALTTTAAGVKPLTEEPSKPATKQDKPIEKPAAPVAGEFLSLRKRPTH
ncbi:hypothetical protein BESB_030990 [Besnoitia besnoiti]|uniref:Uncharacterized protein n=1 Tax=Besnoitia besnoiti TaxID=94643 RepID=A0A2A9LZQ1_BESBE|nr:hypothetical protein BESB_030990 [Besnoitia besnoiti]PFH31225.1 hypothetical protein BESB_030990 [Besnoitia besnoiti]